jgi:poly(3-hydroxybutyrate) depolymerase
MIPTMRTLLALAFASSAALAQETGLLEDSIPPGKNFQVAAFRFWAPPGNTPLRAMLVLVPGSNGDGRAMAQDTVWQQFATKHNLGIIACRFTDKPDNPERAFESYIAVSKGSGDALQAALTHFADRTKRWEVANIPFLMWGMSAGGQFNYEYVAWKPDRVAGFVVNKGGVYYSALLSRESRRVPGILFTGGKDLEFRTNTINGLFNVNRRGGALWALAEEPSAAHVVGRSRDVAMAFYEDIIPLRLANPGQPLKPLDEKAGFLGEIKAKTFAPQGDKSTPTYPTAWLPTERVAKAWAWLVTERPGTP